MVFLFFQRIAWIAMAFSTRFVFKFEIIGRENVKNIKPPLIIAINHKDYWDHFFLGFAIASNLKSPFLPLRFISADSLFKKFEGIAIFLLGGFPAHKGKGLEFSLKEPMEILKNNGVVVFYPEGWTVKEPDKIGEPKKGVGALALWSGVQVLPAAIKGSHDKKNGIKMVFGQPFFIKEYIVFRDPNGTEEDFIRASQVIMDKVKELYFLV